MFSSKKLLAGLLALSLACSPVAAQVPITGAGNASAAAESGTPVSNACINSSGTTITFTAQGVGGANPRRISVVSINWSDSTAAGTAELTAVTIGGINMARQVRASGDNQNSNSEIWYVANPTGTTANIVATFSTAVDGVTIEVYSLIGYLSVIATTTGTTSVSQTYNNKQLAIAVASRTVNVSTSLSNMTNDYSSACGASLWGVHASQRLTGNGTLSSAISPTSNNPKIALAVWQTTTASACASNITGVLGNWDMSVTASVTTGAGLAITNIADISGQGNHFGDGNIANKPIYNATGFNSRPTMASVVGLSIQNTVAFPMGTGNTLTFYWVGSMGSATNVYGMPLSYGAGGSINNTGAWYFSRESNTQAFRFNRNASALTPAMVYDAPYRIIGTIDSGGAMTLYVNGVATTGATQAGNWISGGDLVMSSNIYDLPGVRNIVGNTSEALVATGFTNSTNAAIVDNCLKLKWGL